jgi:Zn ribbon nucleic-acid-binding protein
MTTIILLQCRSCEREVSLAPSEADGLVCPHCRKSITLRVDRSLIEKHMVQTCVTCGHDSLYIQKDFNRSLGVAIVVVGVLTSVLFLSRSEPLYAMLSLGVTAAVDYVLYRMVGDVTVCYACHTIYRGFSKNPSHSTFDLKDLEKYGGRDPRW